jgi:hypothetical protein
LDRTCFLAADFATAGLRATAFFDGFETLTCFLAGAAFFFGATVFLADAPGFLDLPAALLTGFEATFAGLAGFFEAAFFALVVRPFSTARERLLTAFGKTVRIVTSKLKTS